MNVAALFRILFLFTCSKIPPSALSFSAAPIVISLSAAAAAVRILAVCRISRLQLLVVVHSSQKAIRRAISDQQH